jgi:hypothetical protein
MLGVIAMASGMTSDDWDEATCKASLAGIAKLAFSPYCSPSCSPLGFCDSDCRVAVAACGKIASHDILEEVMSGGDFHHIIVGIVGGEHVAGCLEDMFTYVTGWGDYRDVPAGVDPDNTPERICNSALMKAESLAPLIATGATPGVDCLLMSTDGASFLRNSSIEAGVCALRNWDEYELELANVTEQNAALLAAAENASAVTVCEEEEEEVYERTRAERLSVLCERSEHKEDALLRD